MKKKTKKQKTRVSRVKPKQRSTPRGRTPAPKPKLFRRAPKGKVDTGLASRLPGSLQEKAVRPREFVPVESEKPYIVDKLAVLESGTNAKRPGGKRRVAFVYVYSDGSTDPPSYGEAEFSRKGTGKSTLDFEHKTRAELNLFKSRKVGPRWAKPEARGAKLVHHGTSATLDPEMGKLKRGASSVREMVEQLLEGHKFPKKGKFEVRVKWSVYDDPMKEKVLEGGKTKKISFDVAKLERGYRDKLRKMAAFYLREDKAVRRASYKAKAVKAELVRRLEHPKDWERLSWTGAKKILKVMQKLDPSGKALGYPKSGVHKYIEEQLLALSKNRAYVVSSSVGFKRVKRRKGKGKRQRTYVPREYKRAPYSEADVWVHRLDQKRKKKAPPKGKRKGKRKGKVKGKSRSTKKPVSKKFAGRRRVTKKK